MNILLFLLALIFGGHFGYAASFKAQLWFAVIMDVILVLVLIGVIVTDIVLSFLEKKD